MPEREVDRGGLKLFLNLVCETCKGCLKGSQKGPNPNSEGSSSLYVHTCLTACTEMSYASTTELCAKIVFLHVPLWVSTAQHQKSHSYAVSAHDTGKCYQKAHGKGQEELSEGIDLITVITRMMPYSFGPENRLFNPQLAAGL